MVSTGNHSNQGGPPFDLNTLFKPPNMAAPNPSNSGYPPSPPTSYPPPSYSFAPQNPTFCHNPLPPLQPNPTAPPLIPNPGACLMALLGTPPTSHGVSPQSSAPQPPPVQPSSSGVSEVLVTSSHSVQPHHDTTAAIGQPPLRLPSHKLPSGRHLVGERFVYDVDVRLQGEVQPQLEVSPITKYQSDPELILGCQVAVNNTYICYGLKMGNIRVLNINTALRALLRGHTQRVTDMAFFAEDVHLLASASVDGRMYVWKISEGADEEGTQQISAYAVVAIHIVGEDGPIHPRVCWHCHKQEILVLAVSHYVLRIDTTKVGKGEAFTVQEPLQCSLDKMINGIQLVGKHDAEVTDLSMCQWMKTRLVSASKDGTIKIWEERKSQPLLVLKPHNGQPVDAAIFLSAPDSPEHIILITAGPQNREVKLWTTSSKDGWLLPSEDESWQCLQTLELKSSAEQRVEEAFFNQVIGLPQIGLLLLANAKKNAIYAVHLEYGAIPAATRMDYLAEFTVTMPILSFTGTSDVLPHGEDVVRVYCVQTHAIQQYALNQSQCLPPQIKNFGLESSDRSVSRDITQGISILEPSERKACDFELGMSGSSPSNPSDIPEPSPEIKRVLSFASDSALLQENPTSRVDSNPVALLAVTNRVDVSSASPSTPESPRLLRKPSDICVDQAVTDYPVVRQIDSSKMNLHSLHSTDSDNMTAQAEVNSPPMFKHPPYLITPSEIIMATSSSDTTVAESKSVSEAKIQKQDAVVNNDASNMELEVKAGFVQESNVSTQVEPQIHTRKENSFCSQASELGADMSRESCMLPTEVYTLKEAQNSIMEALAQPSNCGKEVCQTVNDVTRKSADFGASASAPSASAHISKSRKQKGKNSQAICMKASSQIAYSSAGPLNDTAAALKLPSAEAALLQLSSIQKMMEQLVTTQKEMQKQMPLVVDVPVAKESRRLEVALGRSIEKAGKANADALWAHMQEEFAKLDKLIWERTQQMTTLVTNCFNKDLIPVLDKTMKKEMAALSTNIARSITPVIEKTISSAISESFQKGVGDKAVNQLERSVNSRVEAIISRQMQVQFQTSGKQALQEGLKSILEASIVPAFELSCKATFEQVDAAFRWGMAEHMTAAQHQIESAHSPLAMSLRETINSASSITQSLSGELTEQRKLVAFAAAGANSGSLLPLSQLNNGPLVIPKVEEPYDPTKELSRLISEHQYEEAFSTALQRSDVSIVSWLCSQVDLQKLLSTNPLPLSQGVLLSLLQQLACDITNETPRKLQWMTDVAAAMDPGDPVIAIHARSVFEQVYQILNNHRSLSTTSTTELASVRVVMHVINSMLMTCK